MVSAESQLPQTLPTAPDRAEYGDFGLPIHPSRSQIGLTDNKDAAIVKPQGSDHIAVEGDFFLFG